MEGKMIENTPLTPNRYESISPEARELIDAYVDFFPELSHPQALQITPKNRGSFVIPGIETLPLEDQIRLYIDVFEEGCSNTQGIEDLHPEDCPDCVRSFVEALKVGIKYEATGLSGLRMSITT